ncbi:AaceriAFL213Wp [[Ashbya] aceris (nom. inval.)]|nr:AaceriAFL213Wp [[Ashbya] aceris (nom. inval.)]
MPAVIDRPKTYKKPTLEDVDPTINYIPAVVRDKLSHESQEMLQRLRKFVDIECLGKEKLYLRELQSHEYDSEQCPTVQRLRVRAEELDLQQLYVRKREFENQEPFYENRLSMLEYCMASFFLGKSQLAQAVMHSHCSMVNVGAMELLLRYGSPEQLSLFLSPMISAQLHSSFMVSESEVSSSDALNVSTSCKIDDSNGTMTLNGSKWFVTSLEDNKCELWLLLAVTEFDEGNIYKRHSVVLLDKEGIKSEGITYERIDTGGPNSITDSNKYYRVQFKNAVVPLNILGERGEGFSMVQTRTSLAKLYQCMKLCGTGHEALRLAQLRASSRKVFGSKLQKTDTFKTDVATWKIKIEVCKLLCCNAAVRCQVEGIKVARDDISMAKIYTPREMSELVNWSIQIHGALGLCTLESPLLHMWHSCRATRINEGPDEALLSQLGKLEISNFAKNQKTWDDELAKAKSS